MFKSVLVLASILVSQNVFAWADRGHQIVGQIAEDTIKPSTKDFVRGILGVEPLAVAAVFPDHVKDDPRFSNKDDAHNFSPFHYCQIPPGSTYDTKAVKDVKDCFGVITGAIALLKTSDPSQKVERQVSLRYLVHVMGDIANPYHVGNSFDQGGNLCKVKWQVAGVTADSNIHEVWDQYLVDYLGQTFADPSKGRKAAVYMSEYMVTLRERHADIMNQSGKDKFGTGTLQSWLEEAAAIRDSGPYPDGGHDPSQRAYCQKGTTDRLPITQAYADKWAPVAEMQLMKGGLRLASTLDAIADFAAKTKVPTMSDSEQEVVLKNLQDLFKNK